MSEFRIVELTEPESLLGEVNGFRTMELIQPSLSSTECDPDSRQWVPVSLDALFREMDHAIEQCDGQDPAPLFRGQRDYEWPLDSTFVRKSIEKLFGLSDYARLNPQIRVSRDFHRAIACLLSLKFGVVGIPSSELRRYEREGHGDAWYEFLKNIQQYAENDSFIDGTFLLDWTRCRDIALYFAVYEGKGPERKISRGHGAVWLFDAASTRKTLQTQRLGEIMALMKTAEFLNCAHGLPLMFHPQCQTDQPRARNQLPVYISQMDFRYDLADAWAVFENEHQKRVFIKFVVRESIKPVIAQYLEAHHVTESVVYPE
jgi:hypothetical protein